jgi:glycosyltransferase involved in cell wall biosynthesis
MRVCLLTSVPLPPGEGLGFHVWNLAHQLHVRGHHVGIITRGQAGPTIEERKDGITIWRVPFAPVYPFHVHLHGVFVNRLLHQIEGQFDVLNAHTPLPPAVDTRLPMVTTVHSPMKADTAATHGSDLRTLALRLQTPVSARIESALFRRSQKITAVAHWVAEALQLYGVEPAQVTITGNGVEPGFLELSANGNREPIVLYVGRFEASKGLLDLLQAARIVLDRHRGPAPRFVLVGSGPLLGTVREMVSQNGLAGQVELKGQIGVDRRPELMELYRMAQLFVLPSHHEGMPTVLLEAMASGLPAVSTAVGGALELIADGENGLLVPPHEPEALASALLSLLADAGLRSDVGRNARTTVQQRYSWAAVAERYLACYEQAVESGG